MPLIGILFFLILFCAGLIYGIYRILGKQAAQAADRFSSLSEEYEKKKAEAKKMTEEAEQNAEKLVLTAQNECEKIKVQTAEEAQQTRLSAVQEARAEAERIVNDAIKARDGIRTELEAQLHDRAIESACDLFYTVFPEALRLEIHHYWLNQLLDSGLDALEKFESREKSQEVSVESAFELTEAEREKIRVSIQDKVQTQLSLREKVNPRLVGGLRLTVGHLVLEASLVSNLKEAARDAQNTHG